MELEAVAARGEPIDIDVPYAEIDGRQCLDIPSVVQAWPILGDDGTTEDVGTTAQDVLARGLATIAVESGADGDSPVGISGGVAVNQAIASTVRRHVERAGFEFIAHEHLPPGDGGLAYGRALVALASIP